jgi:hypothetical protein
MTIEIFGRLLNVAARNEGTARILDLGLSIGSAMSGSPMIRGSSAIPFRAN